MSFFDFHIHIQGDYSDIERKLDKIYSSIKLIHTEMAKTKAEFSQALAEIGTSLDNIAADIVRLTDSLQNGGLSEAEEEEVFAELRAVADRAKAIADTTPEPEEPETPPTPEV